MRRRYEVADRVQKGRLLDEFCETTGMHRKAAIRLLNRKRGPSINRRGRPERYGPALAEALVKVWEVGDRMCGKLLAAAMPDLVAGLERHRELRLTAEIRSQLLEVSPATIDRLLSRHRRRLGVQPQRRTTTEGSLKAEIPVRTWSEWKGTPVGSLQADLVLHCGETTGGFYLVSLCAVEVATGWTELEAVFGLGRQRVGTAVHHIRQRVPFTLKSLHTDNGAEFINHTLYNWCRQEQVAFSRGRSYRKNDQAYVEQRNWQTVRRLVGYDRLTSRPAFALLGQLYPLLCDQLNFFRPVRKLIGKERVGSKVTKHYDTPRSAYQRLMESDALDAHQRAELRRRMEALNPADLHRRIDAALRALWQLGQQERKMVKDTG
jgi:transposase InsO family protein